MKNTNGKGDSYRKVDQKTYDKNYAKAFPKKKKAPDSSPDKVSGEDWDWGRWVQRELVAARAAGDEDFVTWMKALILALTMNEDLVLKKNKRLLTGMRQAKQGKVSKKNPLNGKK